MNWLFCIDTVEKRALRLCYGSMNIDTGKGCGDGYSDATSGEGFGGLYNSEGDGRREHYSVGFGTGTGDGNLRRRGGLFTGRSTCPKTWF